METDMHLALFDLDNTLLPIDSDYEWSRFLARLGVLDGDEYERENNRFYEQYKAGSLDIAEFLQFQLAPLAAHPRDTLDRWHARFMAEVVMPTITDQARELVDRHRERGDLIALVTATNAFVTAPIARAFGIDHLVATTLEEADGQFTGRPKGTPSFREGKIVRTHEWLGSIGQRFDGFERSWFYSDSRNDIALLEQVTDPVATNPDPILHATAITRGWPVLRLFEGNT
jgi:HAD superfamily hydrolase (TIGR01490 family)